jgi:hypothetical protein
LYPPVNASLIGHVEFVHNLIEHPASFEFGGQLSGERAPCSPIVRRIQPMRILNIIRTGLVIANAVGIAGVGETIRLVYDLAAQLLR